MQYKIKNVKYKKKKLKKIMFIIILLVIILIVSLLIIFNKIKSDELDYEHDAYKYGTPVYIKEEERKIYPENIYTVVYKYDGEVDLTKLYSNIYNFKYYIEKLSIDTKKLSDVDIDSYYSKHKSLVKKYTGLDNIEDFRLLVLDSRKLIDNTEFEKAEMVLDTLQVDDIKLTCQIKFHYSDEIVLRYTLNVYNKNSVDNVFVYKPISE